MTSTFAAGESSVTRDLLPLAFTIAAERRLDDELFVTAWLFEEGKHADFFRRYLTEVIGLESLQEPELGPRSRRLFDEELPRAMDRLIVDRSPVAQARALTTYCLIIEGVLADTGQRVFDETLEPRDLLPGLREGLRLVNRDEARHVAFGLHVLGRLAKADAAVPEAVQECATRLADVAKAVADSVAVQSEGGRLGSSYAVHGSLERLLTQLRRLHADDG